MKRNTALQELALSAVEDERVSTFGPPPENPFHSLRVRANLTQSAFAMECDVSKQALIRLEQGTFNGPLPRVVDYRVSYLGYNELQLVEEYEEFQALMRKRHTRYFGNITDLLVRHQNSSSPIYTMHPMRILRGRINPTEVAKALCIPQATLVYFERRVVQQKSVPKLLVQVLDSIGYRRKEIETFELAYATYRNDVVAGRVRVARMEDLDE